MQKKTYYTEYEARDVALTMTERSMVPVWVYPYEWGWQVTGRGDLLQSAAVMPPFELFANYLHCEPNFERGHRPRKVYRVAWTGDGFTQCHQPVDVKWISAVLRQDYAVVIARPRDQFLDNKQFIRKLRPYMPGYFIAAKECGYRHVVLIANRSQGSALSDIYDAVVMYQIMSAPSKLFRGIRPYGEDARRESQRIC